MKWRPPRRVPRSDVEHGVVRLETDADHEVELEPTDHLPLAADGGAGVLLNADVCVLAVSVEIVLRSIEPLDALLVCFSPEKAFYALEHGHRQVRQRRSAGLPRRSRKVETTSFRFKGKRVHVNCDAELNLKREYP